MTHEDEPLEPKTLDPKSHTGSLDEDVPFDDFESGGGFRAAINKNPALKVGLIVGVLILLVIAFLMFGKGSKTPIATSTLKTHADKVVGQPASSVSPAYKQAVEDQNAQNVEKALQTGGSAIPVSTTPAASAVPALPTTPSQEDPLERWRRIERDRAKQDQTQAAALPAAQQAQQDPNAQAVKELANAMSQQMQSVLQSVKIVHQQHANVTEVKKLADTTNGTGTGAGGANDPNAVGQDVNIIQPAGSIVYAQLITEANSDVNGPILAEIVGGRLSGARLLGSFSKQNDEFLVLQFNTVVINGVGHSTQAYAVDPATDTTALVTDIDHKYFDRIILPAAAAFIEGLGSAVAQTGTTVDQSDSSTIVSTPKLNTKQQLFSGISVAAQQAGSVLNQDGQAQQVRVTVAAGTPMGILFIAPVTDQQQ